MRTPRGSKVDRVVPHLVPDGAFVEWIDGPIRPSRNAALAERAASQSLGVGKGALRQPYCTVVAERAAAGDECRVVQRTASSIDSEAVGRAVHSRELASRLRVREVQVVTA
jgi:hypothetical protein